MSKNTQSSTPNRGNPSSKQNVERWKTKEIIIPVVLALISLFGTIIAALISSPLVDRLFPPATETSLSISIPIAQITLSSTSSPALQTTPFPTSTNEKLSISIPTPQITPFPINSGDRLFFSRSNNYYMMSLDETHETQIANAVIRCPSISNDGKQIMFYSFLDEVFTINYDGGKLKYLTNGIPIGKDCGAWRPDDKQLLFINTYVNGLIVDILAIDADGKNEINLTDTRANNKNISLRVWNTITETAWAPDGTKFVFSSNRDGDENVYIYDMLSGETYKVTNNKADDYRASWSPDGTKIVYTSVVQGENTDLFLIDVANLSTLPKGGTNITNNTAHDTDASWSPDGKQIVFVSDRNGNSEIYVMDTFGRNVLRITNTSDDEHKPRWIK